MSTVSNRQRFTRALVVFTLALLCEACGSLNSSPPVSPVDEDIAGQKRHYGSFGYTSKANTLSRDTAAVEDGIKLITKTLLVDLMVRPVTTVKALVGLNLKSISGFVDRKIIAGVRLPTVQNKPVPALADTEPMDPVTWEKRLDELNAGNVFNGDINLLVDGEAYYDRLTRAIEAAEHSVYIRTYIFDNDDVALELADLLRRKSEQVDIKIMVDGLADLFASRLDSESMPSDTQLPPSISRYLTYQSKVQFRKGSNPWGTGDHVKLTVIDGRVAFVGGMNIGREYRHDWHDVMMEVQGPIVQRLQHEFDLAWENSGTFGDFAMLLRAMQGPDVSNSEEGYPIRILSTSIHNSELYHAQVAAIRSAQQRIFIENTYFSDDKILFELILARRRGVDVRVILSDKSDSGVLDLSNQKTINVMLHNGIRVYRYPGMTHVKAAVYDGWACLGSANFDKLSLQINKEINLATSDPVMVTALLDSVFHPDFEISTELHEVQQLDSRHYLAELIADEFY